LQPGYRLYREHFTLHQPRTEARQGRLADSHCGKREVTGRHVVHPCLNHRRCQVRHPRQAPVPIPNEDQELLQDPSVSLDSSFSLAALLEPEVTELLDQLGELLGHGLGPPARATTTLSPPSGRG